MTKRYHDFSLSAQTFGRILSVVLFCMGVAIPIFATADVPLEARVVGAILPILSSIVVFRFVSRFVEVDTIAGTVTTYPGGKLYSLDGFNLVKLIIVAKSEPGAANPRVLFAPHLLGRAGQVRIGKAKLLEDAEPEAKELAASLRLNFAVKGRVYLENPDDQTLLERFNPGESSPRPKEGSVRVDISPDRIRGKTVLKVDATDFRIENQEGRILDSGSTEELMFFDLWGRELLALFRGNKKVMVGHDKMEEAELRKIRDTVLDFLGR